MMPGCSFGGRSRLMLHTAAFWLVRSVRGDPRRPRRLRLLKIAARVVKHASRTRANLPASWSEKNLFHLIALGLCPSGP